jgi:hypothetical protein
MSIAEAMYPNCGPDCTSCGMLCKRADVIDSTFASKLAFLMECMLVDYHGHWQAACDLLDAYKLEWEKINPTPPTFMGEPMPAERRERLKDMIEGSAIRARGQA